MDRILIIDFLNFCWKANVIFKPKKQVEGYEDEKSEPVKKAAPPENVVVYNYFRNLRALIEVFSPHQVICALEGHPAFRYELLPSYKENRIIKTGSDTTKDAGRIEAKARLEAALSNITRLTKYLPISTARHPNYEADDVIGSLVEDLKDEDVVVVSGDSDLVQLHQLGYANFRLYHPIKKVMVSAPDYHYLTWKCLAGDKKSDNIPGFMSAAKAEKLVRDPEALKAWLEKTTENASNFAINRKLIELAKVDLSEIEFETGTPDYTRLAIEFKQLEFESILEEAYWTRFQQTFKAIRFANPEGDSQ